MSLLVRLLARGAASVHTPAQGNAHNPDTGGLTQHGRSMRTAWQSFTRLLADYQWYILAVAGGVAFVLGCIGWWRILNPGQHPIPSDGAFVAYWSFKDFFMNAPSERNIPWELDVARFLAPVVAGWAGLSALGLLFRDRSQQMKIPWMRGLS